VAAPSPQKRRRALSVRSQRGVAMLIAVVSIAILTVMATEFAYNSRVDLELATNQRDEIRAYYMARSAIGLSRLVLKFQRQIDQTPIPNLAGLLQNIPGMAPPAGGQAAPQSTTMNLQIWRMARVDCHMLRGMVQSDVDPRDRAREESSAGKGKFAFDDEFPDVATAQAKRSFGGFEGCFLATIGDEEEKININKLDAPQLSAQAVVGSLGSLFGDKRFDFIFETEDSNRVKVKPAELIVNLRDWADEDEVQANLNQTGQGDVFLKGFSDENADYDKYNPRYKAKNGRFDTLDELYMVHGVNDRFMAAFRDRLTVYPDINSRLNVNTDDPVLLYMAILAVADPARPDPRLQNPLFVDQLIKQIRSARMFSFLGTGVVDFVNLVAAAGVPVNESIKNNVQNNRFVSDKSTTYSIKAVGEAGTVQKTITAVVRLDDGLGKLVYWREE
jgi:general secretion pathway protein K